MAYSVKAEVEVDGDTWQKSHENALSDEPLLDSSHK
jgi:hypothetical protein